MLYCGLDGTGCHDKTVTLRGHCDLKNFGVHWHRVSNMSGFITENTLITIYTITPLNPLLLSEVGIKEVKTQSKQKPAVSL